MGAKVQDSVHKKEKDAVVEQRFDVQCRSKVLLEKVSNSFHSTEDETLLVTAIALAVELFIDVCDCHP